MKKDVYELTSSQKAILSTEQFYSGTSICNIGGTLLFKEKVDFDLLEQAINIFIKKNDGTRIQLIIENNVPKQYIKPYEYLKLKLVEVSNDELNSLEESNISIPLNIINSQLFNFILVKLPDGTGGFTTKLHHLISDAWSMKLVIDQITSIYKKLIDKENFSTDSEYSYVDYIHKEQEYLSGSTCEKDKEYWDKVFELSPECTSLKNNDDISCKFERKEFQFDSNTLRKVNDFCKQEKISPFIFYLSIYSIYFGNILNTNNYIIGNPTLNRSNFSEKNTLGLFICTQPFVININNENTFTEHCNALTQQQKNMYRHLKYPFNSILENIRKTHGSSDRLFDIIFSYQNARANNKDSGIPFSSKWIPNKSQIESIMIHIKDIDNTGNLFIDYDYLIDVFTEKEIVDFHNCILGMINQVLSDMLLPIKNIDIVNNDDKNYLINTLNDTFMEYDKNLTIIDVFEEQVKKYPNKIALSSGDISLTYSELNNRANIVATKLQSLGVKNKHIVALMLNRNENMIITILGILKSGATYMPIDPDYPSDRIKFMLDNSATYALVTTKSLFDNINYENQTVFIDNLNFNDTIENLNIKYSSDSLSYIMYTSGSTGNPKAVSIKHYNVINFVKSMQKRLNYIPDEENIVLSVTTMCFDIFVFEVFPTLLSGLHLVIANEMEARSPELLSKIIIDKKISKILTTPSRMKLLFFDEKYLKSLDYLKEIILGGEPFPKELLHDFQKITKAKLYNLYGPTETTVYSTFKDLTNEKEITIGNPIENTEIYILNNNNKIMPVGCVGEICIGGCGVGNGYYNNPNLTDQVFIQNPYKENDIIYKTGDLGKWNSKEELVCLGRKDFQIKIRGYRVELGDIVSNIITFPNITDAVVIDQTNPKGEKYLCAYIVSDIIIDTNQLHKYLTQKIPNYMVPSHFMQIEKIPLNLNHKVDRKALPMPVFEEHIEEMEYVAPRNSIEKLLCNLIAEHLNISRIGITNDIFNYSLDSLGIIQIQTKLLPYKLKINTQLFYKYRTIEEIVNHISIEDSYTDEIDETSLSTVNQAFEQHTDVIRTPMKKTYNNILLIGNTGFLGIHLLRDFLENTNSNIFCLIRGKNELNSNDRLISLWNYYFKDMPLDYNRIKIINADVTEPNFGLDESVYNNLSSSVDLVVNSAANVKYYGDYSEFKKVNVDLTANLINFCIDNNIEYAHVSTLGVSGNFLVENKNQVNSFTENDFYIGQNYKQNVYIQTKFEAENMIYTKVKDGLKASIFRVGNLTGRYSDGVFQKNIEDNAFYNMLNLILKYKALPKNMLTNCLEFTPIDFCSLAICKLIHNYDTTNMVFHIFNNNLISINNLLDYLETTGLSVSILENDTFTAQIEELLKLNPKETILKGFINNLDEEKGLFFSSMVEQKNNFTNNYLAELKFNWATIDSQYIEKIIKVLKEGIK